MSLMKHMMIGIKETCWTRCRSGTTKIKGKLWQQMFTVMDQIVQLEQIQSYIITIELVLKQLIERISTDNSYLEKKCLTKWVKRLRFQNSYTCMTEHYLMQISLQKDI